MSAQITMLPETVLVYTTTITVQQMFFFSSADIYSLHPLIGIILAKNFFQESASPKAWTARLHLPPALVAPCTYKALEYYACRHPPLLQIALHQFKPVIYNIQSVQAVMRVMGIHY